MNQVLKLVENYVIQRVMSNHAPLTHANKALSISCAMVFFFSLVGLGFCLSGLYLWLLTTTPQHITMMIMGGVLIALALTISIATFLIQRLKQRKIKQARQKLTKEIVATVKLIDDEISNISFIQENPKASCLYASLLGYIIANKTL